MLETIVMSSHFCIASGQIIHIKLRVSWYALMSSICFMSFSVVEKEMVHPPFFVIAQYRPFKGTCISSCCICTTLKTTFHLFDVTSDDFLKWATVYWSVLLFSTELVVVGLHIINLVGIFSRDASLVDMLAIAIGVT